MRGTKAYIASAGTSVVMLGASICTFALVSALVAFGSWPGSASHTNVDQVVLRSLQRPHAAAVTVNPNAVAVARRAARRAAARTLAAAPRTAAGTPVAAAPRTPTGTSARPQTVPSAPSGGSGGGLGVSVPDVKQGVGDTTQQVTTKVQDQVNNVQTQVDQVVDQVVGGPAPSTVGGAVDTTTGAVGGAVDTTTNAVTGVLGP